MHRPFRLAALPALLALAAGLCFMLALGPAAIHRALAQGRPFALINAALMVVLATAHPAKFPDAVEKATGQRPALPARLGDLLERAERVDGLRNDVEALKAMIDERRAMATAPATRAKVKT